MPIVSCLLLLLLSRCVCTAHNVHNVHLFTACIFTFITFCLCNTILYEHSMPLQVMLCYVLLVLLSFYVYGTLERNFNQFDAKVPIFTALNLLYTIIRSLRGAGL
jgi:hypothetical protein